MGGLIHCGIDISRNGFFSQLPCERIYWLHRFQNRNSTSYLHHRSSIDYLQKRTQVYFQPYINTQSKSMSRIRSSAGCRGANSIGLSGKTEAKRRLMYFSRATFSRILLLVHRSKDLEPLRLFRISRQLVNILMTSKVLIRADISQDHYCKISHRPKLKLGADGED
jgi:hypothetical protein